MPRRGVPLHSKIIQDLDILATLTKEALYYFISELIKAFINNDRKIVNRDYFYTFILYITHKYFLQMQDMKEKEGGRMGISVNAKVTCDIAILMDQKTTETKWLPR